MMQAKKSEQQIHYAGIPRRIGAFAYDFILLLAVLLLAVGLIMPFSHGAIQPGNPFMQFYLVLVIFLFFGWFWVNGGQTLGMRAWKIRVELDNGRNLGWAQALLRFALAVATFAYGLLWCLWDPQYRALYDVLARTRVVRVDKGYVPPAS